MIDKKVFIACPISKHFDKGIVEESYKKFIEELYNELKNNYREVFLALEREKYGKARMEGHICTPLDFKEMKDADLLIAIPEDSMGVAVEIGWASALKKEIVVVLDKKYKTSPLIENINTITKSNNINIDSTFGYTECINIIRDFLNKNNEKR